MAAADGDSHAADANRDGVAAEGAEVQRLDGYALIEAEMPESAGLAFAERSPIDGRNPGTGA
jgi:hypothetical protein